MVQSISSFLVIFSVCLIVFLSFSSSQLESSISFQLIRSVESHGLNSINELIQKELSKTEIDQLKSNYMTNNQHEDQIKNENTSTDQDEIDRNQSDQLHLSSHDNYDNNDINYDNSSDLHTSDYILLPTIPSSIVDSDEINQNEIDTKDYKSASLDSFNNDNLANLVHQSDDSAFLSSNSFGKQSSLKATGKCSNDDDKKIIDSDKIDHSIHKDIENCARSTFGSEEKSRICIHNSAHLSLECSGCFATDVACTFSNCKWPCTWHGADSSQCLDCSNDYCGNQLVSCTGLVHDDLPKSNRSSIKKQQPNHKLFNREWMIDWYPKRIAKEFCSWPIKFIKKLEKKSKPANKQIAIR